MCLQWSNNWDKSRVRSGIRKKDLHVITFLRLTIWTAIIMKDIAVIEKDETEKLRTITTANVSWLLASGWMFYFCSLLLNLVYYLMHPSSPEMWTWGKEEELREWTHPGKREAMTDREQLVSGQKSKVSDSASQIELPELLPIESNWKWEKNYEM